MTSHKTVKRENGKRTEGMNVFVKQMNSVKRQMNVKEIHMYVEMNSKTYVSKTNMNYEQNT